MTTLADAFERVGLPTSDVAFASACRDLARLALNRDPNPRRATVHWLELTAHQGFREALMDYLSAIAEERTITKSVEGRDQGIDDTRPGVIPPSTDTNTDDDQDQVRDDPLWEGVPSSSVPHPSDSGDQVQVAAQKLHVSASDGPEREGGDQLFRDTQKYDVAPLAPRGPTEAQTRAVIDAKAASARVMSGIYITERQGSRTPIEDVTVASLERRLKWLGGRAAKSALEFNYIWQLYRHTGKQGYIPPHAVISDIIDAAQLVRFYNLARSFGDQPMVQLPETLRGELAA